MRPRPAGAVVEWFDRNPAPALFTSAVSRAEIELGLALMAPGRRQAQLGKAASAMFEEEFGGRCLPFDERAAVHYARIVAGRRRAGRPVSVEDAQIAAIALAHDLTLATRNTADFVAIDGLAVADPWLI